MLKGVRMLKNRLLILFSMFIIAISAVNVQAKGGNFGFGLSLGEPTAISARYILSKQNSLKFHLGSSYFGALRIGGEYLWHFNAFNSPLFSLYAGPGAVIGLGDGDGWFYKKDKDDFYYSDNGFGLGVKVLAGISFVPRNSPIEVFLEIGPLIGIAPSFGTKFEGALGIHFYP